MVRVTEACAPRGAGCGVRGAAREESSLQKTRSSKLAARLRFDSGSHSLLSYCTCVARRSLIYVSLVWAQSRDGDGSARLWLCDFSVGRSAAGHRSVDAEGSCPPSGSGGGVGSPR